MKKDYSRIFIVLLILLSILIAFLIYYAFFNSSNKEKLKEETLKQELTRQDIERYLYYVPTLDDLNDTHSYEDYGYSKDAYSANKETVNTLDERLLMKKAYDISMREDTDETVILSQCPKGCKADTYILKEELMDSLKYLYNITKVSSTSFRYMYGNVEDTGKYYASIDDENRPYYYEKINKIIKYDIEDNNLIIYEKAGFISSIGKGEDVRITKTSSIESKVKSYIYTDLNAPFKYMDEHLDEFYTFKHTFKPHEDGNFYWYSTEVEK